MPFKTTSLLNDYPLSIPTAFADLESLRQELLEVIEQRLDEIETLPWAEPDMQFHFVRSQIIVFDTREKIEEPEQLVEAVPKMSVGSIFYHFIDARRRSPEMMDDFRSWLRSYGDVMRTFAHNWLQWIPILDPSWNCARN